MAFLREKLNGSELLAWLMQEQLIGKEKYVEVDRVFDIRVCSFKTANKTKRILSFASHFDQ